VPVPETCVEIRAEVPVETPAITPAARRRWPRIALAVSLPLGLIAVAAVRVIAADMR
jgi:hypothetical protein